MVLLKINEANGDLTVVLTDEARDLLKVGAGDALCLVETDDGRIEVQTRSPTHEERLERGRKFIDRYRSTFEALAK